MSFASPRSSVHWSDLAHPVVAGLISVIVNYGGTFILVFQAAKVAGLSPELTASWVWSVSIGVGITGIILSCAYRGLVIGLIAHGVLNGRWPKRALRPSGSIVSSGGRAK
ncbi:benzoate/H(+) symporter BenE family transporter [Marinobacter daepoensis]|uniref:Benzoate/H(+) symporter BenE family transporter n=1 Tax=Marinobacter daepoensis TaxID=262077 RepID=A0ABS3BAW7_9GAMM|nr:benzoate/H(+) symporter BenE family transporter [Marinobacter daepoensis]MBN7768673.1 benzoate/H(+) symporter BenE family transporter [Marinobacter daepoensis]MBY6079410.1 benzoate/H(+) symporter BenE family transporter [Marinobacter daepoensis]